MTRSELEEGENNCWNGGNNRAEIGYIVEAEMPESPREWDSSHQG